MDKTRAQQWRAAMAALEQKFPALKCLHRGILQACKYLIKKLEQRCDQSSGPVSYVIFTAMEVIGF